MRRACRECSAGSVPGVRATERASTIPTKERPPMQLNEITEILNLPLSQELLGRDLLRMAYVAKDGTPRNIPIAFTWNGSEIVVCTTKNAPKLPALRQQPGGCPDDRHRGAPTQDLARPRPGRAGLRRWHPGRVSPGDQHLRDDPPSNGSTGRRKCVRST